MVSIKPDRPIDRLTVAVMREIDALAHELELPYFVCGAMARDILLTHVHGINTGSETRDVDFGIAVSSWAQFENIKRRLVETGRFKPVDKVAQCLLYTLNDNAAGYPVDIIPFRGVEQPPNTVAWPPDRGDVMNVIGYEEVLAAALKVEVEPGLLLSVISLPGIALLKLFAWADRGLKSSKDARDLAILFRHYTDAGNYDRVLAEMPDVLERLDYKIDLAGVRLLGRDVHNMAAAGTLDQIAQLTADDGRMEKLVTHLATQLRAYEFDDAISLAEDYLAQFKAGLSGS